MLKFTTFLILIILEVTILSTNGQTFVDTNYPIVFTDNFKHSNKLSTFLPSHFGFSVAFVKPFQNQTSSNNYPQSWLFIGAPKGTSNDPTYPSNVKESGVIWRCSLGGNVNENCEILHLDPIPNARQKECNQDTCQDFPVFESKNQTWVGGYIESIIESENHGKGLDSSSGRFVSCAHRWARGNTYSFMNGLCYSFQSNQINQLYTTDENNFMKDKINMTTFGHRIIPFFEKHDRYRKSNVNQYFMLNSVENVNKNRNARNDSNQGVKYAVGESGLSFHTFRIKESNKVEMIMGAPGVYIWAGAVIRYQDTAAIRAGQLKRQNAIITNEFRQYMISTRKNSDSENWYDYFGYAVTSGHYNISNNQRLYAAGAPRSNVLQGGVIIFDFPQENEQPVEELFVLKQNTFPSDNNEEQTGSYFGSVLLTANFNGDAYDDLFVGAPLYSSRSAVAAVVSSAPISSPVLTPENLSSQESDSDNVNFMTEGDEGCVFLYSSEKEFSGNTPPRRLLGESQPGARFGSAISNIGDVNNDGFIDIAVGAPYQDGRGVVYIYLGRPDDVVQRIISWNQRILASSFNLPPGNPSLSGFGISISKGFDIDGNQTPDIAIGSFLSNQVVVLRTRPSIQITARLIFEIHEGDKRRNISLLPKQQELFIIKSCVKFDRKVGAPSTSISLKTTLSIDQRYQRFSLSIINRNFPPSIMISNSSTTYHETLTIGKEECNEFEAVRLTEYPDHMIDNIPPIKLNVKVVQETQFKDTNSTMIRHHKIISVPSSKASYRNLNIPAVEFVNDQPKFDAFCPSCTYHTQVEFDFSLPVSNCIHSNCIPNLKIEGGFLVPESGNKNNHLMDRFVIGSNKKLILHLVVSNDGDTATSPKLNVKWMKTGLKTTLRPLECPDVPFRTPGLATLNCNLGNSLRTGNNKTLDIIFDMTDIYAQQEQEFLNITVEVSRVRDDSSGPDTAKSFQLILISDPNLKIRIVASPTKEIYFLASSFEQFYQIYIEGKSSVAQIEIRLKIPINATIQGQVKQVGRVIRVYDGLREGIRCIIPKEAYSQIEIPNSQDGTQQTTTSSTLAPPSKVPPDGDDADYVDVNVMPTDELDVGRKRRDLSTKVTTANDIEQHPFVAMKITKENFGSPDQDTVLLSCDDETSSLNVKCVPVTCTAENVQAGSSLLLTFGLGLLAGSAQELLDSTEKNTILFRTHAVAQITRLGFSDQDSGQTIIRTAHQSASVAAWIYIVAAVVGFILLALIVFILHKFGFFHREKKEQLNELKAQDSILRQSMKSRTGSIPVDTTSKNDQTVEEVESSILLSNEHRLSTLDGDQNLINHQNTDDQQHLTE